MSCLTRPAPLRSFMPVMRFFVPRIRKFTTSPSPPSERDPSHPHLWYHPGSSFIRYLPLGEATIDDFKEEPKFLKVLEEAIKSGISQGKATTVEFEAETRPTDGWIHINDERAIPPAGRIGETEDIIGSVYVQQGKIVADTYSSLPTYRLVTPNGVLTLPKGLDQHLISVLEGIDAEERKTDSVN
ncbi:hypothetical protein L204_104252 [Cryptococcus depauperatus]